MKKVLMGSVFAMILAAGITTSLAAPGGYRDGICDYTAQSSGWTYTDEDNDGVCDYAGQSVGWRFVDEDNDGVCDYAGQGGCGYADADGDGVCDYYGEGGCGRGAGFVDEDGDGVCDFGGGTRPMDGTGYRRCGRNR